MARYEVRDQNGDMLESFDSWGLAVTYFHNWIPHIERDANAGACIFDTETQTVQMAFDPEGE